MNEAVAVESDEKPVAEKGPVKLNKQEREIERAAANGEFRRVTKAEFEAIAHAVARRKKEATLNIRINRQDLENLKKKPSTSTFLTRR